MTKEGIPRGDQGQEAAQKVEITTIGDQTEIQEDSHIPITIKLEEVQKVRTGIGHLGTNKNSLPGLEETNLLEIDVTMDLLTEEITMMARDQGQNLIIEIELLQDHHLEITQLNKFPSQQLDLGSIAAG
jgi:hypothetical protein